VVSEAWAWIGTPYHHHARLKGKGVDCAQLLCAVYFDAGVVPEIVTGHYAIDWHLHRGEELYLDWLARFGRRLEPGEQVQGGDVAVYRFGRTFSHGCIYVSEIELVHSYLGAGVILTRLDEEPLASRERQDWTLWKA